MTINLSDPQWWLVLLAMAGGIWAFAQNAYAARSLSKAVDHLSEEISDLKVWLKNVSTRLGNTEQEVKQLQKDIRESRG